MRTYLSVCGFEIPFGKVQNISSVLNGLFDIRKCLPAKGKLRKLQKANTILLDIFDVICRTNGLLYYLDDGTLLGAVRHSGFIPWDDDIDVSIPIEQYDKLVEVLQTTLKGTGLLLYGVDRVRLGTNTLRITLDGFESVNLDIFYSYCFNRPLSDRKRIEALWREERWRYHINFWEIEKKCTKENLRRFRDDIDGHFTSAVGNGVGFLSEEARILCMPVYYQKPHVVEMSDVLPLGEMEFEGKRYPVPAKSEKYLTEIFGDIYSFPPTLSLHGDAFLGFDDAAIDAATKRLEEIYGRLAKEFADS